MRCALPGPAALRCMDAACAARAARQRCGDLRWELVRYSDPTASLALTDVDRIALRQQQAQQQQQQQQQPEEQASPISAASSAVGTGASAHADEASASVSAASASAASRLSVAGDPCGRHTALVLSFTLPQSTYATMALRELTKQSSSQAHQSQLTATAAAAAAAAVRQ